MFIRPVLVALAASATLLVGCSSEPKITRITPEAGSSEASSSSEASTEEETSEESAETAGTASGPLDVDACVEVTEAQLDIFLAGNAEEATPPAETLKSYGPPADVIEAIDHFVEVGGIQFDDPDATTYTDTLEAWVGEVCPS